MPLEILITSGGTQCPIDDVRSIGNFSNGTTGALIAEEFLSEGYKVHFLYGKGSARPFRRNLTLNPEKEFEEEKTRLEEVYNKFHKYKDLLEEYPYITFSDYHNSLKDLLTKRQIDAVVLAAAVSDYGTEKRTGKISSDKDKLIIELTKNPKVINFVKQWRPEVYQIGFKLLSNVSADKLAEVAYAHGRLNNSDLTVANSLNKGSVEKATTMLVYPDGTSMEIIRKDLSRKLVEAVRNNFR
jgi:phosphopantothenate--cysteine ligase